jgi:hypothetical protein
MVKKWDWLKHTYIIKVINHPRISNWIFLWVWIQNSTMYIFIWISIIFVILSIFKKHLFLAIRLFDKKNKLFYIEKKTL